MITYDEFNSDKEKFIGICDAIYKNYRIMILQNKYTEEYHGHVTNITGTEPLCYLRSMSKDQVNLELYYYIDNDLKGQYSL